MVGCNFFTEDFVGVLFFFFQFFCVGKVVLVCKAHDFYYVAGFDANRFFYLAKYQGQVVSVAGWGDYVLARAAEFLKFR